MISKACAFSRVLWIYFIGSQIAPRLSAHMGATNVFSINYFNLFEAPQFLDLKRCESKFFERWNYCYIVLQNWNQTTDWSYGPLIIFNRSLGYFNLPEVLEPQGNPQEVSISVFFSSLLDYSCSTPLTKETLSLCKDANLRSS